MGKFWWYWWILSVFICLGMAKFLLNFWRVVFLDKNSFRYKQYFTFTTLITTTYCLEAPLVSGEKSTVNLIEEPLYILLFFFCCFQNFSLWFLSFGYLIMICLGVDILEFILVLEFLDCRLFFTHFGAISHYFLICYFCPILSFLSIWDSL